MSANIIIQTKITQYSGTFLVRWWQSPPSLLCSSTFVIRNLWDTTNGKKCKWIIIGEQATAVKTVNIRGRVAKLASDKTVGYAHRWRLAGVATDWVAAAWVLVLLSPRNVQSSQAKSAVPSAGEVCPVWSVVIEKMTPGSTMGVTQWGFQPMIWASERVTACCCASNIKIKVDNKKSFYACLTSKSTVWGDQSHQVIMKILWNSETIWDFR